MATSSELIYSKINDFANTPLIILQEIHTAEIRHEFNVNDFFALRLGTVKGKKNIESDYDDLLGLTERECLTDEYEGFSTVYFKGFFNKKTYERINIEVSYPEYLRLLENPFVYMDKFFQKHIEDMPLTQLTY